MAARILIIEDHPTNLKLMVYLLKAFGYEPLTASNGAEGLEAVRRDAPDLVVCDLQMAGIDGYEVARRLKAHPVFKSIPLVAVTALAMVGDRDRALAEGFDGYVAKPINPEAFVQQVEAFLKSDVQAASRAAALLGRTAGRPEPARQRHVRVLLVDNSPVNHALMRSTLEPFGFEITSAHSVAEGLDEARSRPPDLFLSDLHMPDADGYDLLEAVKADARLKAIPFAFISSTFWPERDLHEGLARGADAFISRPIDPQALLTRIEDCLRKAGKA